MLDLLGRDGFILPRADPGGDFVAMASLGEFVQESLHAAALGEKAGQHTEERVGAAGVVTGLVCPPRIESRNPMAERLSVCEFGVGGRIEKTGQGGELFRFALVYGDDLEVVGAGLFQDKGFQDLTGGVPGTVPQLVAKRE